MPSWRFAVFALSAGNRCLRSFFLFTLPAGAVADIVNRRTVIASAVLWQAAWSVILACPTPPLERPVRKQKGRETLSFSTTIFKKSPCVRESNRRNSNISRSEWSYSPCPIFWQGRHG